MKEAIEQMANKLQREKVVDDNTLYLVMLNGGVWFSNQLFEAMGDIPNEVQYIKGHSYEGQQSGEFVWDLKPCTDLTGKDVVVIDDICDSGKTIKAIYDELKDQAKSIIAVTLLKRLPSPVEMGLPVYACIEDESKDFFVGCGLDDNGRGRLIRHVAVC